MVPGDRFLLQELLAAVDIRGLDAHRGGKLRQHSTHPEERGCQKAGGSPVDGLGLAYSEGIVGVADGQPRLRHLGQQAAVIIGISGRAGRGVDAPGDPTAVVVGVDTIGIGTTPVARGLLMFVMVPLVSTFLLSNRNYIL